MRGPDWYILAQNVMPWEPHIGVFCLKFSAMGAPDWYVYAHDVVPLETQTGVFRLTIYCHGRPSPVC